MPAGSAFGELALINSKPRAATIICEEKCHFAVLDKAPFESILSNIKGNYLSLTYCYRGERNAEIIQ